MVSSFSRHARSLVPALIPFFLLFTLLAGCSANISVPTSSGSNGSNGSNTICLDASCTPVASSGSSQSLGSGANGVKVFVEPDMGITVITSAIRQAQKSVWLEMYLLTSTSIIKALEEDAHRGLDVRVMLEAHPYGSGSLSPTQTLDRLSAAGVKTKSTSPDFSLTHEKGMLIDGSTAYIMSSNFTLSALGGSRSTKNREYGIIDTNTQDVQAVTTIFNDDWNRTTLSQESDPNLVVSPINSHDDFTALIHSAKKTLLVEAEEMQDSGIEQALSSAAHRGVQVQVILPAPSTSSSDGSGSNDANSQGIATIKQAGVQVKESTVLYMHAKMFVVDGKQGFVGSENISTASLEHNRELGILVSDASVITTLSQTFQQDWNTSQSA